MNRNHIAGMIREKRTDGAIQVTRRVSRLRHRLALDSTRNREESVVNTIAKFGSISRRLAGRSADLRAWQARSR
jgi:hypothetical protein